MLSDIWKDIDRDICNDISSGISNDISSYISNNISDDNSNIESAKIHWMYFCSISQHFCFYSKIYYNWNISALIWRLKWIKVHEEPLATGEFTCRSVRSEWFSCRVFEMSNWSVWKSLNCIHGYLSCTVLLCYQY